ncbi:hypothetical protein Ddye_029491 [Dipteronia dyeriana]|uniref:SET domain-containing protein n=1 Tax=Dipteronia dyeriana TaxID=168575 RepID=A0AAD9TFM2_9ROSI|nr:hypothetical protein Ddye_029491 [Dipteronia dyeriana]
MSAECLVSIAEIEGRGRSVVASQALKAGQVLLTDSPILLYSPLPFINPQSHQHRSYCNHCSKTLLQSPFSPCPSCSLLFCNATCLSRASSSSHSPYVCQALSRLQNSSLLLLERHLQARFLIAAFNLSIVSPPRFQTLLSLQGTVTDHDASDAHFLHSLISTICPPPSIPSIELTAALLAKDRLNAFGLMEPFNQHLQRSVRAYGIYPKASFFNHDCLPNACRFDYVDTARHNNTDIIVRILHDVPQGREICLSYFPVNLDYSTRQKRLLEDYGFACDCDRCKVEANWSDNDNDKDGVDNNEEEEDEVMDEDEDEDEQMVASGGAENEDTDFPHAYFFVTYMCNVNNCGGTLAPLPPSPVSPSNVMECNVCSNLKNKDAV